MNQQGFGLDIFQDDGLFDALHAGKPAIFVAEQEITIAGHEKQCRAGIGKGAEMGQQRSGDSAGRIVADPDFEQVTENVKRTGPASRAVQVVDQEFGGLRAACIQMQVGDQVDGSVSQN